MLEFLAGSDSAMMSRKSSDGKFFIGLFDRSAGGMDGSREEPRPKRLIVGSWNGISAGCGAIARSSMGSNSSAGRLNIELSF